MGVKERKTGDESREAEKESDSVRPNRPSGGNGFPFISNLVGS